MTNESYRLRDVELSGGIMAFSLRSENAPPDSATAVNVEKDSDCAEFSFSTKLESLCNGLAIKSSGSISCNQVHGDEILIADHVPQIPPVADAIIAIRAGLFPTIQTADCVPILIIDPKTRISAAIHAGWKGTVLRITRKVIMTLKKSFNSKNDNLIVAIGPAIGSCCYEVDELVLDPLISNIPWASKFIFPHDKQSKPDPRKKNLDLPGVNYQEIRNLGIPNENIYHIKICSFCGSQRVHSYRRDGSKAGRNIAITGFRTVNQ